MCLRFANTSRLMKRDGGCRAYYCLAGPAWPPAAGLAVPCTTTSAITRQHSLLAWDPICSTSPSWPSWLRASASPDSVREAIQSSQAPPAALFRLDPRRPDNRPPLFGFVLAQHTECFGSLLFARRQSLTKLGETRAHRRIGQSSHSRRIELGNDV